MSKATNDALRAKYVSILNKALSELGEDAMLTNSNEIAIPVVDGDGEDNWVVFTVKVPTGSRDGDIYDGYSMAEEYKMKQADKKTRAAEAARKKEIKIAKDREMREQKAAAKAAHEAAKAN